MACLIHTATGLIPPKLTPLLLIFIPAFVFMNLGVGTWAALMAPAPRSSEALGQAGAWSLVRLLANLVWIAEIFVGRTLWHLPIWGIGVVTTLTNLAVGALAFWQSGRLFVDYCPIEFTQN